MEWLKGYQSDIIAFWSGIEKILVNVGSESILWLYILIGKNKLKADYIEFLSALLRDDKLDRLVHYIRRCDYIVKRFFLLL